MGKKTLRDKLKCFCEIALVKAGLSMGEALIVSEVLVTNDEMGVNSHGTTLLRNYIRQLMAGGVNTNAEPTIVINEPSLVIVDGNGGLGILTAYKATEIAIGKAKETGICITSVRGSNHAAAMGYYALMCAKENMIGIVMSNSNPVMSIPGTKGRIIGNNPFAYAIPAGKANIVFFDVSMSVISGGKIKNFELEGKSCPDNWLVDKNGNPTTDPSVFRKGGTLLPFALHKGYGFAVMIECLAGILSGAGFTKRNVDWVAYPGAKNNIGHMIIALDIKRFTPLKEFIARMELFVDELHNADCADGIKRIFLPGEIELEKMEKAKGGFYPGDATYENLRLLAEELGIEDDYKNVWVSDSL